MKFSINWLKDFIQIDNSQAEFVADSLTNRGIEVESMDAQGKGLDNVVVGKILSKQKHPDADKLSLLSVDAGKEKLQIVCGASNMKEGDNVVVSLVGAKLPNGLEIKKTKIRGVESFGMCCSLSELKMAEESDGIIILPETAVPGTPITEAMELDDVVIDIATAANRGDILGMLGISREVGSILGKKPEFKVQPVLKTQKGHGPLAVEIHDKRCRRYIGRYIEGVKIKPSPRWMCKKLEAVGLRPINNLVDITNYVMYELGQPLHVFDASMVAGKKIIVRSAKENEKIKLLDGTEKTLLPRDLLITDEKHPLAIAGVMGGEGSGVYDTTKDVILECAYFEPSSIRVTAKKHGISTDSSYRFERGVDFDLMKDVVERATQLIQELGEPEKIYEALDVVSDPKKNRSIKISARAAADFLGMEIDSGVIAACLKSIGFEAVSNQDNINVEIPSWRGDVSLQADIYEEVARVYGFDKIPAELPAVSVDPDFENLPNIDVVNSRARHALKGLGYFEAITYTFVPDTHHEAMGYDQDSVIKVLNPIAETMKVMRVSMIPGLLDAVRYNLNHRNMDVKLFEIGKTYHPKREQEHYGDKPSPSQTIASEQGVLCMLLSGNVIDRENWKAQKEKKVDFYTAKGDLNYLLEYLRVPSYDLQGLKDGEAKYLNPGAAASVKCCGRPCGYIGKLHPEMAAKFDLEGLDLYIVELYTDVLKDVFGSTPVFKELPKFPNVRRDLSFITDAKINDADIMQAIKKARVAGLKEFGVFDLYKGKGVPEGKKSMAYMFVFGSDERTLTDAEVDGSMKIVSELLKSEFSIEIR